ncbi:hypothetical protein AWB80_07539 [Caballeronia pedi]|uniref:Uncharacterized protein n=1 Tax=Caballeronia pedi TaxID=1777141 RepID=A0A158DVA3_9BURK|nr:hypothetical protein [Caballeronia pedi]SAK98508.1 hypothetical protein AWB80_07539 [Caballeronia pedi]
MRENNVLRAVWLAVASLRTTLFRINTGRAYVSGGGEPYRLADGSVVVPNARPIALGFADPTGTPVEGTSDLVGWTEIVITPQMVGRTVAVFTAIETKESGGGKKRKGQIRFVDRVQKAGGIAGFAPSDAAAKAIVEGYKSFDRII